jgi:Metallo-peptidase family M12B Reprolysin-like/Reprolysin family propeptide
LFSTCRVFSYNFGVSMLKKLSVLFVLITIFSLSALAQTSAADLSKSFVKFKLVKLDTKSSFKQISRNGKLSIADFNLNLTPRDLRSPKYKAEETNANGNRTLEKGFITTYKGTVNGVENSAVRLSVAEDKVEGFIFVGDEKFYVEPASKYSKSADKSDYVVYRGEDLLKGEEMSCSIGEKIERGKGVVNKNVSDATTTFKVLEVATEADFEYVSAFGSSSATNNEILATLNMVEGVYEHELGITLSVTFQHTWTTADPYPNTGAGNVLTSFRAFWNANYPMSGFPRDTAHIWTAKSNSSAQGIAYFQAVCRTPQDAYGLTGYLDLVPTKFILTAHEIGHNLGANHVDGNQGCADTTMNPILSNITPFTFCTASRGEIGGYLGGNGGCLSNQVSAPIKFDFDGDRKSDIGVFRPSNGVWYITNSGNSSFSIFQFGQNGDKIVDEDYDGDGKTDAAVYRNGTWYVLRSTTNTFYGAAFGTPTDVPVPADFDGDNKADLNVFRASEGNWYRLNSTNGAFSVTTFGTNGDIPVPADYDGDGKADVNLFRPSNGVWYRLNSATGSFYAAQFGQNGDKPLAGDFNGDGKNDMTVYRNGVWYSYYEATGTYSANYFGLATDIPAPGDFDGDGKTDVCVYRNGTWYRLNSGNGAFVVNQFGTGGDIPTQAR